MAAHHTTTQDTRTALIDAAVEMFAEFGFEGASTRAIAQCAATNIGGIHYHFGSKEALYVEAFRHALGVNKGHPVQRAIHLAPGDMASPEGRARTVRRAMAFAMEDLFLHSPQALQFRRLLLRELASPSPAMPLLIKEVFQPSHEEFRSLCLMIRPDMPDEEAHAWSFLPATQWVFYAQAGGPVSRVLEEDALPESMLRTVESMASRSMVLLLELPIPDDFEAQGDIVREALKKEAEQQ